MTTVYYIVWNEEHTEGLIEIDYAEALRIIETKGSPNSLGQEFKFVYSEDKMTLERIEI